MNEALCLECAVLDGNHAEALTMLEELRGDCGARFAELFSAFLRHTQAHFAAEEQLMLSSGFGLVGEHTGEHRGLLGEMARLEQRLQQGKTSLARAFVRERLPEWLERHIRQIDSQFALFLKTKGLCQNSVNE